MGRCKILPFQHLDFSIPSFIVASSIPSSVHSQSCIVDLNSSSCHSPIFWILTIKSVCSSSVLNTYLKVLVLFFHLFNFFLHLLNFLVCLLPRRFNYFQFFVYDICSCRVVNELPIFFILLSICSLSFEALSFCLIDLISSPIILNIFFIVCISLCESLLCSCAFGSAPKVASNDVTCGDALGLGSCVFFSCLRSWHLENFFPAISYIEL